MMNDLEYELNGYYQPGFFHILVNTELEITDLNKLASQQETINLFSTFFHEYIHFLQDITTVSGIINAGHYIDMIKDFNMRIRTAKDNQFEVPIEVNNTYNVEANIRLRQLSRGDSVFNDTRFQKVRYDGYVINEVEIQDKDGNIKKPKEYKVFFQNIHNHNTYSFVFGGTCLREYVAHTLQHRFMPQTEHPDIPYHIAELIVFKECPTFPKDELFVAALCDASLNSLHPSEVFFSNIARINNQSFVPKDIKEVYDFVENNLGFESNGELMDMPSLYNMVLNFTKGQLKDALKSEIFVNDLKWILHILSLGQELRMQERGFMISLVESENKLSQSCLSIFKKIGTPFFTNSNFQGGIVPPNLQVVPIQPNIFLAFSEILKVFFGAQKCELFKFCKSSPSGDITNEDCNCAPWNRINLDQLCSFAQLWKTWGLAGKTPITKN